MTAIGDNGHSGKLDKCLHRTGSRLTRVCRDEGTAGGIDELASLGLGASETLASEALEERTSSLVARMKAPSAEWRRIQRVPFVRHP